MKEIVKYIIIFITNIALFVSLLTLVAMIPSELIEENARESAELLLSEKQYYEREFLGNKVKFDNYADSLMINNAYSMDSNNPLESALIIKRNYVPGVTIEILPEQIGNPVGIVDERMDLLSTVNKEMTIAKEYSKYWHGYLVFLKPLLVFFNYGQIRNIQLVILALLTLILFFLTKTKFGISKAIVFLISFLIVNLQAIYLSLEYTGVFILMFSVSIYLLLRYEKIKNLNIIFFITGSITCFIDFLTAPIVTLGIPLIIYFLFESKKEYDLKNIIMAILKSCIFWGIGYCFTWIAKFVIVDLLYDKELIKNGINQVMFRTKGTKKEEKTDVLKSIFSKCNLDIFFIIFLVQILIILINCRKCIRFNKKKILIYIIISLLPIMWYMVLKQHSKQHDFFTSRALLVFWISILLIIDDIIMLNNKVYKRYKIENKLKRILKWKKNLN